MTDDYKKGYADAMGWKIENYLEHLPQRTWVGLTDEEIKDIIGPWGDTLVSGYTRKLFDQIEAKLKDKNRRTHD